MGVWGISNISWSFPVVKMGVGGHHLESLYSADVSECGAELKAGQTNSILSE